MLFRLALLLLGAFVAHPAAHAAVFTVGPSGTGCNFSSLPLALSTAALTPGEHEIRLVSGDYGTNSGFVIENPIAGDITIQGGYTRCSDSQPSESGRSTLTRTSGSGFSVLRLKSNDWRPAFVVRLRRLSITNGLSSFGSGIALFGPVILQLDDDARISGNKAVNWGLGGGIAAECGYDDPVNCPELTLIDATISNNHAEYPVYGYGGGGIASVGPVHIHLFNATFRNNTSAGDGGGLYMVGAAWNRGRAKLQITPWSTSHVVSFTNNRAGIPGSYSHQNGDGGAMLLSGVDVEMPSPIGNHYNLILQDNIGNRGGAIWASHGKVELANAWVVNNTARGQGGAFWSGAGMRWDIRGTGANRCFFLLVFAPCSLISGNRAENSNTVSTRPVAGGVFYSDPPAGQDATHASFERTQFSGNQSLNAPASVFAVSGKVNLTVHRSIFRGNKGPSGSSLLKSAGTERVNFSYNTVVDNEVTRLFSMTDGVLNVQGSIFWDPGTPIWYHNSTASMVFNDCLVSHTGSDIPGGAAIANPRLGADHTPSPWSPAVDACDEWGTAAGRDFYGRQAYDVRGIGNIWGVNDLGAVEQVDAIFLGGFGNRPTH